MWSYKVKTYIIALLNFSKNLKSHLKTFDIVTLSLTQISYHSKTCLIHLYIITIILKANNFPSNYFCMRFNTQGKHDKSRWDPTKDWFTGQRLASLNFTRYYTVSNIDLLYLSTLSLAFTIKYYIFVYCIGRVRNAVSCAVLKCFFFLFFFVFVDAVYLMLICPKYKTVLFINRSKQVERKFMAIHCIRNRLLVDFVFFPSISLS